jgi:hypothetical protein
MDIHPQGHGDGAAADALAEAEAELRSVKTSLAILSQEKDEQGLALNVLRKHMMQSIEQLTLVQQAIDSKVLKKPVRASMAITARDKQRRAAAGVLIARNRALLMSLTHALAGMPSPVDFDSYVFSPEERAALLGSNAGSGAVQTAATTLRGMFERRKQAGRSGADDDDEDDDDSDGGGEQLTGGDSTGMGAHHHHASASAGRGAPPATHRHGSGGPTLLDAAGPSNTARLLSLLGDTVLASSSPSSPAAAAASAAATGGRGGRRRATSDAAASAGDRDGGSGGAQGSAAELDGDGATAHRHGGALSSSSSLVGGGEGDDADSNPVLTIGGLTADDVQRALAAAHLGGVTVAGIARSQAATRAVRHCLRTSRVRGPLSDNPDTLCRILSFLPHADLGRASCEWEELEERRRAGTLSDGLARACAAYLLLQVSAGCGALRRCARTVLSTGISPARCVVVGRGGRALHA